MKPADWPRYMVPRRLAAGKVAYYWEPRSKDVRAGCPIKGGPLGSDYGDARRRAEQLNEELDAWRSGSALVGPGRAGAGTGTIRGAKGTTKPATRDEVYKLAEALRAHGYPHLGACALMPSNGTSVRRTC